MIKRLDKHSKNDYIIINRERKSHNLKKGDKDMTNHTQKKEIKEICKANDVRFSATEEQNNPVYSLHGFLADIEAVERKINGYHIEAGQTGHYLYRQDLGWE